MRHQETIYIQNDNSAVRNKDILNVNMSSDFCVFQSPTFNVSGATKVQCDSINTCALTGYSFSDMLTAATYNCFTSQGINTGCYSATTWETRIYENGSVAYSATLYTSTNLTAGTPSSGSFLTSVTTAFYTLGYDYSLSGTTYTIYKPYGVKDLMVDVCITFDIVTGQGVGCPSGYSANTGNDGCEKIVTTGATYNGSGATIVAGTQNTNYAQYGAYFYPSIQDNGALPVYYDGLINLKNQTGGTITPTNIVNAANSFWFNSGNTSDGRLNQIGLSASTTEFLGFSKCLDIPLSGTYYVGIAADNECNVTLNGVLLVSLSGSANENFKIWSVFETTLLSGKNIIEMVGKNLGSATAFGAEIYNPTSLSVLTGATTTGSSQANVIFSTEEYVGGYWSLGTTVGYTCPSGYSLDNCGTGYSCSEIFKTGFTSGCTGTCSSNCTIICNDSFPYIDNTSQGVYVNDPTTTTIPITFVFTGNTNMFSANNTTFKYEIYNFNASLGLFTVPPVYKSGIINYSTFSGTNILQQSIPLTGLTIDGDYLIKGYYEADACTDFLKRLGKKIDTVVYKQGPVYQLYDSALDYYFVSILKADTPLFTQTQPNNLSYYDALPLYQQVIIVDDSLDYSVTSDQPSPPIVATGNTYERSGSTITLVSEYLGDIVVTLNGSSLAKDVDYTLSGVVLTFLGAIVNGDVITIIYTRTSALTIVSNVIELNSAIVSGATGTQGSNRYFYNTTTGKYEIFTNNEPIDNSRIIVILNGVTLASDIDYYQSTSDKNRIILQGSLSVGDIVIIVYYPKANIINGITQVSNYIGWYIPNPPQASNGEFELQYGTDSTFSTYFSNQVVPYQTYVTNYSSILQLTGDVGTQWFYRVKNTKNYRSICGDVVQSVAYSETVPVIIQTNAINAY